MNKLLVIFSFLFINIVFAADSEKIKIVTEEWAPYNYSENGNIVGVSTEIVKKTLKEAGLKYSINIYPWARAYKIAQKEPNVVVYTMYRSKKRENIFRWIGPIKALSNSYFYALKSRKIKLRSINDAKKYKIGVMNQDNSHQYLKRLGFKEGKNLEIVHNEVLNIKKLLSGRVDLITSHELTLLARMKKNKLPYGKLQKLIPFIIDKKSYGYMAVSKSTSDKIYRRIKKAFRKLQREHIVEKTTDNYIRQHAR
jgi:polar amino acid transport system substrate-binding protein